MLNFENTDTGHMNDKDPNKNINPNYRSELREGVKLVEVPVGLYSSEKINSITLQYYNAEGVITDLPASDKSESKEMRRYVGIQIHRAADGVYGETTQTLTIDLDKDMYSDTKTSDTDKVYNYLRQKPEMQFVLFKDLDPNLNPDAQRLVKTRDLAKFIATNVDWKKDQHYDTMMQLG